MRIKKTIITLIVITMIISVSGCVKNKDKQSLSIRYLTDVSGTSDANTQSVVKIIKSYSQDYGYSLNLHVTTPSSNSDYAQSAKSLLAADSDFVLATSSNAISSLLALADEYPDKNIITIGSAQNSGLAMEVDFKTEDSGYLAGIAAAASSTTGKIAYIGGLAKDDMQSLIGFYTGAKSYNQDIIIYYDYVGSYNDYEAAYTLTYQFCASGADIIFCNCGGSGLGVYDAANACTAKLITTDMYDFPNDDIIIAETVKNYQNAASYAIELFMNGEYTKSVVRIGLVIGAVDIELSDKVSETVSDLVQSTKDSMKQYNTIIPSTWGEYNTYF